MMAIFAKCIGMWVNKFVDILCISADILSIWRGEGGYILPCELFYSYILLLNLFNHWFFTIFSNFEDAMYNNYALSGVQKVPFDWMFHATQDFPLYSSYFSKWWVLFSFPLRSRKFARRISETVEKMVKSSEFFSDVGLGESSSLFRKIPHRTRRKHDQANFARL